MCIYKVQRQEKLISHRRLQDGGSLQGQHDWRGHEASWVVLGICYFLIWVPIIQTRSSFENLLSCLLRMCAPFAKYDRLQQK